MVAKLIKTIRINEWIHFLGVPFLGYFFASGNFSFTETASIILISIITLSFGFVINYWANLNSDFRPRKILIVTSLLLLLAGGLALELSNQAYLFWFLTTLFLFLYSSPPFVLKRFPVIVTLMNGLSLGLFFLFGFAIKKQVSLNSILLASFFGLNLIPLQLIHEWEHKDEDIQNNCYPTVIYLTHKKLIGVVVSLYLIILALASYLQMAIDIFSSFLLLTGFFTLSSIIIVIRRREDIITSRKPLKKLGAIYSFIVLILILL